MIVLLRLGGLGSGDLGWVGDGGDGGGGVWDFVCWIGDRYVGMEIVTRDYNHGFRREYLGI